MQDSLLDEDILEPNYNPGLDEYDQTDNESACDNQDIECPWVDLTPEVTNPIDDVLRSRIEQHRREAAQFNLRSVFDTLHPMYLALKSRTKNWTGPNADQSFVNCKCLPHTLTKRFVDTIDILDVKCPSVDVQTIAFGCSNKVISRVLQYSLKPPSLCA
ncbi:hypothetical protein PCANC_06164 [Puccinia coronata f. sp. avenae]|uniref:CxC1-like cysteine cluster associated with KDZ transposases domain-containing protein n=1 Tax=Puccinia coronata f. sp. avenae TaxID=200324 RepID=A0A2N5VTI1_9BASI|nr:hypothetical protein PCANC_06164 [Puccinia coronata f. sp. avenae]